MQNKATVDEKVKMAALWRAEYRQKLETRNSPH
jgi:hypothetical protein